MLQNGTKHAVPSFNTPKLNFLGPFLALNRILHNNNGDRSGQMTYCLNALISTVILAPCRGITMKKSYAIRSMLLEYLYIVVHCFYALL